MDQRRAGDGADARRADQRPRSSSRAVERGYLVVTSGGDAIGCCGESRMSVSRQNRKDRQQIFSDLVLKADIARPYLQGDCDAEPRWLPLRRGPLRNGLEADARDILPLQILPAGNRIGLYGGADFRDGEFSDYVGDSRDALASKGSGKQVTINFCATCGTKLFLAFERFPGIFGVYGGTFDDPNWFARTPQMSRHIFLDFAQQGTIIPAGVSAFRQHTMLNDGTPVAAMTFEQPHTIDGGRRRTATRPVSRRIRR